MADGEIVWVMRWLQLDLGLEYTTGNTLYRKLDKIQDLCRKRNAKLGASQYFSWPVEYIMKGDKPSVEIKEHLDGIGIPPRALKHLKGRERKPAQPRSGRG